MPRAVIHDNDGHVDDILSTILLWLSPELSVLAVTVTEGDCFVVQAFEALLKIATFLDIKGGELAYSELPCPNPFPDNWRRESYIINELPIFGDNALKMPFQSRRPRKSTAVIADCLSASRVPVTLVCTGPLTNIVPVFEESPDLKEKVDSIIFMGGAFGVPGNVEMPEHDGTAEWNIYADPVAAKRTLELGIPMTFIPLDVTNHVPVTREFILRLDEQAERCRSSQLAAKLYSLVKGFNYYFWDTITAAALIRPELFTFKEQRIDIATQGRSQGRTQTTLFGKKVKIATSIQVEPFEQFVLEVLRRK